MSLDITLTEERYSANITHNLRPMAEEAGIYRMVWHGEGVESAGDLILPLDRAIRDMKDDPERFRKHDASNGWGTYKDFLPWLERLLIACRQFPDAEVSHCR